MLARTAATSSASCCLPDAARGRDDARRIRMCRDEFAACVGPDIPVGVSIGAAQWTLRSARFRTG
jgi:hypothetical protein